MKPVCERKAVDLAPRTTDFRALADIVLTGLRADPPLAEE